MKTVLLVEDDPFLIDIYSAKLNGSGFLAEVVESGDLPLKKMREKKPDLVLLDLVLPKVDGWEILKQIKEDPDLKSVPVVLFSNLSQQGDVERGISMGAAKYLIKSHYTPSEVVEEIKKILK